MLRASLGLPNLGHGGERGRGAVGGVHGEDGCMEGRESATLEEEGSISRSSREIYTRAPICPCPPWEVGEVLRSTLRRHLCLERFKGRETPGLDLKT